MYLHIARRVRPLALGLIAGLSLASCADQDHLLTNPAALTTRFDRAVEFAPPHVFHTKSYYAKAQASSGGSGTGIYYHGGSLLTSATNVAAVYWASAPIYTNGPAAGTSGAGVGDGSLVGFFLRNLGGSSYFNINTTYYNGAGTHVQNVVNYTQYWANNQYQVPVDGQNVTDANMIAMLQYGFDHGNLTYDPTTLYAVFTAGTVNLGGGFGTQYCAYHYHGTVTIGGVARTVLYAAMPYDAAYPNVCTNGTASPNGDVGADAIVNTLAHEVEETTTDLLGTAWYDRRGYENADKCAWTWGSTYTTSNGGVANIQIGGKDFLVQRNWVNAGSGGCATRY